MSELLLFAGHRYYPAGGALDFHMHGTVEECKSWFALNANFIARESGAGYIDNWGQIVDPQTMQILEYGTMKSIASGTHWAPTEEELEGF